MSARPRLRRTAVDASGRTRRRRASVADALGTIVAASLIVVVGYVDGAGWCAIPAGAAVWWRLARAERWAPGALAAACMVAPVPAIALEGLASLAPALWLAVTVGIAAAYGVAGSTAALLVRAAPRAVRPLAWGLGWATLDTVVVHASPWALPPITPGYVLLDGPFVAWGAVGGPVALGLAWLVLGAAVAAALGGFRPAPGAHPSPVVRWPPGSRAWGAAAGVVVLGTVGLQVAAARTPIGSEVTVAVSQGVATEAALHASRDDRAEAESLLTALVERARTRPADLHVWPEVALGFAHPGTPAQASAAAAALGAPILAGAYRRDPEDGWRNAVLLADAARATWVVDKRRLVPGYEAWLQPGVGERWPVRAAGLRWGVLVCWESLFLDLARERLRGGADVLVVLAHDGWAGASVTPRWHARAGRLLAWATGRPVVVASHDGPSMAWSHDGRRLGEAAAVTDGLTVSVAAPLHWIPPYARFGGRGVAAALAAAWMGLLAATVATRSTATGRRAGRQGCGADAPQAA